uniref:Uncharacterized protein n=1 Tax=viral metagenome TaxID=1070528 RepID=A0A6C0EK25_9ZZZZ
MSTADYINKSEDQPLSTSSGTNFLGAGSAYPCVNYGPNRISNTMPLEYRNRSNASRTILSERFKAKKRIRIFYKIEI